MHPLLGSGQGFSTGAALMARTMVANIPGARLREAERELATLKGEAAVTAFLEAHPNETKVLQQLVEWRRAGRAAPPLARVQRAMLWSDGTIEFRIEPGDLVGRPSGAARSGESARAGRRPPGSAPRATSPPAAGQGQGTRAAPFARRTEGRAAPVAGAVGGGGRPARGPAAPRHGPTRPAGTRPPAAPRRPGGRRADRGADESGMRGLPRAGEGWALVREGETLPHEPPAETAGGVAGPEGTPPAEDSALGAAAAREGAAAPAGTTAGAQNSPAVPGGPDEGPDATSSEDAPEAGAR
jgi:hypothetical protein